MANTNSSKLMELTLQISSITKTIILELEHAGATEPDFSSTSTEVPSTPAYNQLRDSLNDAAQDLLLLVNGPMTHARTFLCTHHDLAAYQIAFEFGFFQAVPTSGKISLSSLAKAVKLDVNIVSRVMYFLCTQRVFNEVDKGEFQHTHGSIVFAREEGLRSAAEYQLDEFFRAAGSTAVALKKGTSNPFVETFGMPLFQYYGQNPKLGARFASAMGGIVKLDRHIAELLHGGFPWHQLKGKKLVDIGGGSGHVSIALAEAFPELQVLVQDGDTTMFGQTRHQDTGPVAEGRVEFMQHDFFAPQPIHDAGAYLLRQITHNWSDAECIKIFRAIVPALESSSISTPLLINDTIVPQHRTTSRFAEHNLRQVDIMMHIALGAKQRTEEEFTQLLHEADTRLKLIKVHGRGSMGLLEVHLMA